ncbi:MAG: SURF1 family protein [Gammaproteobacteria bacterium]|nr:SURF1 family protein [Gammaproteobacteria bacterium]
MVIGRRKFEPAGWTIALTAAGVSLCVVLGLWQLDRAALKESIELKFEQRLVEKYQAFSAGDSLDDIEYRKLLLQGSYDNTRHLLVDNQLHRGAAGYHVLTPLKLKDSDDFILVNRGWSAWGVSREELPSIPPATSTDGVAGIANYPNEPALRLGGINPSGPWPRLIPYIDIEALQTQFSGGLLPVVLWLAPEQSGAFVRDWNPVWMKPEKSRAYAAQWFAFALIALVFFVILNLRKIE